MSDTLHAILAHKPFTFPEQYKFDYDDVCVFSQKRIKTNLPFKKYKVEGVDDRIFGEFAIWKWLVENDKKHEWFVLHHYRRYLNTYYHHFCVAEPIHFNCSVLQQTAACHSVKLVQMLQSVMHPQDFALLNSLNYLLPYNMMSIHRDVLVEWVKFMDYYMTKLVQLIGISDYDTMVKTVASDTTFTSNVMPNGQVNESKNCDPKYQCRIFAFLSERLNTLFWLKNMHLQPWYCTVDLLEQNQKI